jgi:hypothetical protein
MVTGRVTTAKRCKGVHPNKFAWLFPGKMQGLRPSDRTLKEKVQSPSHAAAQRSFRVKRQRRGACGESSVFLRRECVTSRACLTRACFSQARNRMERFQKAYRAWLVGRDEFIGARNTTTTAVYRPRLLPVSKRTPTMFAVRWSETQRKSMFVTTTNQKLLSHLSLGTVANRKKTALWCSLTHSLIMTRPYFFLRCPAIPVSARWYPLEVDYTNDEKL